MSEKTKFADVRFKAGEFADGTCHLGTLEDGPNNEVLTLIFRKDISFPEAEAVASYLNERIDKVGLRHRSR